jgi:murein DD-endopeptidase MepM/ murein hydrolase activator NlpD
MNIILGLLLSFVVLQGSVFEEKKWEKGQTYLTFLKKNKLPLSLYYEIDDKDKELTEDLYTGINYQISYDSKKNIEQVLIPINDELQIHIMKYKKYIFEIIPIIYEKRRHSCRIKINNSPYADIKEKTGSSLLAIEFANAFKNSLNFKNDLRKNDTLVIIYERKYRAGKLFGGPKILACMIEVKEKRHSIYLHTNERYYDERGKQLERFLFKPPVVNFHITSNFTKRRYHPILGRYRAHSGVDFGAKYGAPIYASGSGKIIEARRSQSFGNVIKIRHEDGYVTLYAHQKKFANGIKLGKWVNKGQLIGYVGTTGRSTGPHLHFSIYKNGRAINPLHAIEIKSKKLSGKSYLAFKKLKRSYDKEINTIIEKNILPVKYEKFIYYSSNSQYLKTPSDTYFAKKIIFN